MVSIKKVFQFTILFYILWGACAWFTWAIELTPILRHFINTLTVIISFLYARTYHVRLRIDIIKLIAIISLFVVYVFHGISLLSPVLFFLRFFLLYVLWCDKEHIAEHLKFCRKWIAIIVTPGLILHLLFFIVGILPSFISIHPNSPTYVFYNYIFVLEDVNQLGLLRYQSVFLEPGYFGTLLAFLLYATRFNFKDRIGKFLLINLLFTVSLAGYITTFLGYIYYLYETNRLGRKGFVIFMVIILGYFISVNYNDGDNIINRGIVERLQVDEEKGISGNNRTGQFALYYFDMMVSSGDIWYGIGHEGVTRINGGNNSNGTYYNQIRGAGYVIYFITNGIICALLCLLLYSCLSIFNKNCNKKYAFGFLLIVFLTFLQVATPLSYSWLLLFILGCTNTISYKKNIYAKKMYNLSISRRGC